MEGINIGGIIGLIEKDKAKNLPLTHAIEIFLMRYYRSAATKDEHKEANRGVLDKIRSYDKELNE